MIIGQMIIGQMIIGQMMGVALGVFSQACRKPPSAAVLDHNLTFVLTTILTTFDHYF